MTHEHSMKLLWWPFSLYVIHDLLRFLNSLLSNCLIFFSLSSWYCTYKIIFLLFYWLELSLDLSLAMEGLWLFGPSFCCPLLQFHKFPQMQWIEDVVEDRPLCMVLWMISPHLCGYFTFRSIFQIWIALVDYNLKHYLFSY